MRIKVRLIIVSLVNLFNLFTPNINIIFCALANYVNKSATNNSVLIFGQTDRIQVDTNSGEKQK